MGGAKKTPDIWWCQQTSSLMISSDIIGYDDIWRYLLILDDIWWYLMYEFSTTQKNPDWTHSRPWIESRGLNDSHLCLHTFFNSHQLRRGLKQTYANLFWFCKPMDLWLNLGKILGMVSMWILVFNLFLSSFCIALVESECGYWNLFFVAGATSWSSSRGHECPAFFTSGLSSWVDGCFRKVFRMNGFDLQKDEAKLLWAPPRHAQVFVMPKLKADLPNRIHTSQQQVFFIGKIESY